MSYQRHALSAYLFTLVLLCLVAVISLDITHAHTQQKSVKKKQPRGYVKAASGGRKAKIVEDDEEDDDDDDVQFGSGKVYTYPKSKKGLLHPELFEFNWDHIHPNLHNTNSPKKWNISEMAEQIYMFPLFTQDYCRKFIEELEHADSWKFHGGETEAHPYLETVVDDHEPEITTDLEQIPGLEDIYYEQARNVLKPIVKHLWPVFDIQKYDDPYAIKYDIGKGGVKRMNLHYDAETVTMIVYLNNDYSGGGTWFPRWNFSTNANGPPTPGTAVLYPGGVSHIHGAKGITDGKRYLLLAAFY